MDFTLTHCKLVPKSRAKEPAIIRILPELPKNANWLDANVRHSVPGSVRRINWVRSFALKGLNYEDYYFIHRDRNNGSGEETYYFQNKFSIEIGAARADVLMVRSADRVGIMQGDVLTYETVVPSFFAEVLWTLRLSIRVPPRKLLNQRWLVSEGDMWALHEHMTERDGENKDILKREFCDKWLEGHASKATNGASIAQLTI